VQAEHDNERVALAAGEILRPGVELLRAQGHRRERVGTEHVRRELPPPRLVMLGHVRGPGSKLPATLPAVNVQRHVQTFDVIRRVGADENEAGVWRGPKQPDEAADEGEAEHPAEHEQRLPNPPRAAAGRRLRALGLPRVFGTAALGACRCGFPARL
jgi:hypothetical protein